MWPFAPSLLTSHAPSEENTWTVLDAIRLFLFYSTTGVQARRSRPMRFLSRIPLALYRERPGAVNFEGERECSGRGVRDTAICSKPSASLSMGIEWSRPSRERRAKGTWVDFVTHRLRNIGGSTVSGRLCWRTPGRRGGWASTRKPGAVERSKWLSRDCIGS